MLNEAGEEWMFRVKYGRRDPARSNEIAEAECAACKCTPLLDRERQRHPSEIRTLHLSARRKGKDDPA